METLGTRYPGAALITGASAGLGEAFAKRCASEGMELVLVARRKERLDAVAEMLTRDHGVKVTVVPQDLTHADAPLAIKQACDDAGVTVSMLINNAGFGTYSAFHETDPEQQLALVDVNCRTPVALANFFLPGMVARKNGAVIFVASTAAYQPCPQIAVYGATKSFNLMLGEALWTELKPHGVDALALSPGYTKTEFHRVARVNKLPSDDLFREPAEVVDTCFQALGRQPSVIDRVTPFDARMKRIKNKLFNLKRFLRTAASAGLLHLADLVALV